MPQQIALNTRLQLRNRKKKKNNASLIFATPGFGTPTSPTGGSISEYRRYQTLPPPLSSVTVLLVSTSMQSALPLILA